MRVFWDNHDAILLVNPFRNLVKHQLKIPCARSTDSSIAVLVETTPAFHLSFPRQSQAENARF